MTVHSWYFAFEALQLFVTVLSESRTPFPPTQPGFLETPKSESRYPSSPDVFTTGRSSPDVFTTGGPTSFLGSQSQSSASGSKGRFFLTLSFFYN